MDKEITLVLGAYGDRMIISASIRLFTLKDMDGVFCTIRPKASEAQRVTIDDLKERRKSNMYWCTLQTVRALGLHYGVLENENQYIDGSLVAEIKSRYINDESINVGKLYSCSYLDYSKQDGDYVYFTRDYSDCCYIQELANPEYADGHPIDRKLVRFLWHMYNYYSCGSNILPQLWVNELTKVIDNAPTDEEQMNYCAEICKKRYEKRDELFSV